MKDGGRAQNALAGADDEEARAPAGTTRRGAMRCAGAGRTESRGFPRRADRNGAKRTERAKGRREK